jgi:hypothetical protein
MPGNVSFSSLDFEGNSAVENKRIIDHLFMLREQLEYTLSHLDSNNFSYKFFDDLTVRVKNGLDIEGVVTFYDLANNSQTLINGAYIKTGIMEASLFRTFTYAKTTETSGELLMYYADTPEDTLEQSFLAGGIRMDDAGLGTDTSSRFRLWIYTSAIPRSGFRVSLKLSSAYQASLEAVRQIYIYCADDNQGVSAGQITIRASVINLEGYVRVNGKEVSTV